MLPSIGQTIQFHIVSQDKQEEEQLYKTRISDIESDQLFIEVPFDERGATKSLYAGDLLKVSYISNVDKVNYFFDAYVRGMLQDNNIRQYIIDKPAKSEISKVQRRSFLRVDAELEVAGRVGSDRFLAVTVDISGGGLSMMTPTKLYENDTIECWLLIQYRNEQIEHVPFQGEIVRIKEEDEGYLLMVRFTNIAESDRQKIVKYCYEKQLELRKK